MAAQSPHIVVDQFRAGLYEFMRLTLDLFELLNDSGEVIRLPIMQSVVCRLADTVKRRSARSLMFLLRDGPR
jgi:hypothetical protein